MSLGQSMLTAAALIIITMVVISANRLILESQQDELAGEAYNLASEIGNALLMEASVKKYDAVSTNTYYQFFWEFTGVNSLGPSSSEAAAVPLPDRYPFKSIGHYNDFDDYNRYWRIVDTPIITGFIVRDSVIYVLVDDLDARTNYQTYLKKMIVTVEHPLYLPRPLQFSTVMAY
jgi:hypothetical protein